MPAQRFVRCFRLAAAAVVIVTTAWSVCGATSPPRRPAGRVTADDTVAVRGVITDDGVSGVEDVVVSFFHGDDSNLNQPLVVFTTDGQGRFSGKVEAGRYYIEYRPSDGSGFPVVYFPGTPPFYDPTGDGWLPVHVNIQNTDFSLVLPRGARFSTSLSVPVAPHLILVETEDCAPRSCPVAIATYYLNGTLGQLTSPLVLPGDYVLGLWTEESSGLPYQYYCGAFEISDAAVIRLEPGDDLVLVDCELTTRPTIEIGGAVADSAGAGIPSVVVNLYSGHDWDLYQPLYSFETDGQGHYSGDVEAGEYHIEFLPPAASGFPWVFYPGTPSFYDPSQDVGWQPITVDAAHLRFDVSLPQGARFRVSFNAPDGTPNTESFTPRLDSVQTVRCEPVDCWVPEAIYHLDAAKRTLQTPWVLPGDYVLPVLFDLGVSVPSQVYCGTLDYDTGRVIHLEPGDDLELPECTLVTSNPEYTISGKVTDESGGALAGIEIVAEPQSGDAAESTTYSQSDGSYVIQARGTYHSVRALPDPTTFLADEWYPDAHCSAYADALLNWRATYDFLSSEHDHTGIDFQLERGGMIELEGLLGRDQEPIGFPVYGAISYLHRWDDVDLHRVHRGGNYFQVCSGFQTDALGRFTSPVLPEHGYVITVNPPSGSGYIPQGYYRVPDGQTGDSISVVAGETTSLAAYELISDEYQPHTSEGTMFRFDENWQDSDSPLYGGGAAGDLDGDGLMDFVLVGVGGGLDEDCPGGLTFGMAVYVFINSGGNRFEDKTDQWVGSTFCGGLLPELADLDLDGYPDLVLVGSSPEWPDRPWGQQAEIWRNIDGDHFESQTGNWIPKDDNPGADGHLSLYFEVADLDNDGDEDLIRTTSVGVQQILLNDGTGRLVDVTDQQDRVDPRVNPSLSASYGLDLADANGDGFLDVLFTIQEAGDTRLGVMLGRGDGLFQMPEPGWRLATPWPGDWIEDHADLESVDLDGDGLLEIYLALELLMTSDCLDLAPAVCRETVLDRLYTIDGVVDGEPTAHEISERIEQSSTFNRSIRVRSADIDNDGDVDIIVGNGGFAYESFTHPDLRVLLNDGDGNLSLLEKSAFPSFTAMAADVELFDSDNDGDLDMLLGGSPTILLINKTIDSSSGP